MSGLLVGDLVRVKKESLTSDWAKKQASGLIEKLKEFVETDLNIRVSSVKALRPSISSSVHAESQVDDFYCDVVIETAPGLYNNFITLPINLLDQVEQDINLADVPESLKRQSPDGSPEEVDVKNEEMDNFMSPKKQTRIENGDYNTPEVDKKLEYSDKPTDNFNTKAYIQGLN
jgi:hypothetical protein